MKYLVFSLVASMGAMGGPSGNGIRGTNSFPGRSALIGLIGAALGRKRDDDFSDLDTLKFDVGIFNSGKVLRDFHTAQGIPSSVTKNASTRRDALKLLKDHPDVNTTLSKRDYRTDVFFGILVRGDDVLLAKIEAALNEPEFTLFLGRKSCPLSAPVDAHIVDVSESGIKGKEEALSTVKCPHWIGRKVSKTLISDASDRTSDSSPARRHSDIAIDVPVDRKHWHFGMREIVHHPISVTIEA